MERRGKSEGWQQQPQQNHNTINNTSNNNSICQALIICLASKRFTCVNSFHLQSDSLSTISLLFFLTDEETKAQGGNV